MPPLHRRGKSIPFFHRDRRECILRSSRPLLPLHWSSDSSSGNAPHPLLSHQCCGFQIHESFSRGDTPGHNPQLSLSESSFSLTGTSVRDSVLRSPEDQTSDSYSVPPVLLLLSPDCPLLPS